MPKWHLRHVVGARGQGLDNGLVEPLQDATAPNLITHGEPVAADVLRLRIEEELQWSFVVPDYLEQVSLTEVVAIGERC